MSHESQQNYYHGTCADLKSGDLIELGDPVLGQDVHHAGGKSAVRHDRDPPCARCSVELPLLGQLPEAMDVGELLEEPAIDLRHFENIFDGPATLESQREEENAFGSTVTVTLAGVTPLDGEIVMPLVVVDTVNGV